MRPRPRWRPRRYIPARAGEARWSAPPPPCPRVHPRACGGSAYVGGVVGCKTGTSPRVRGKLGGRGVVAPGIRYIPARAGEARPSSSRRGAGGVHPRACGGSCRLWALKAASLGTSPRVRGKRVQDSVRIQHVGYIPARAGEAGGPHPDREEPGVHPRACGGSVRCRLAGGPRPGTSPRVRGKRAGGLGKAARIGYIPARAGEAP